MAAKRLICTNAKGGTGKTTTCFNIAGILSKQGYKVLCIDSDPQANLSIVLGVNISTVTKSLADVINGNHPAADCLVNALPNLDVLPATLALDTVQTLPSMATRRKQSGILAMKLKGLEDNYDFIITDTASSASITPLTFASLAYSDLAIVPVVPNALDVAGLGTVTRIIAGMRKDYWNERLSLFMVVAQQMQRNKVCAQNWAHVQRLFPEAAKTAIRRNVTVAASLGAMKPLCYYNTNCNGYFDYEALTEEILLRLEMTGVTH